MEQAFKVGDRVECIDGYAMHPSGPYRGWTGTVRGFFNIYNPIVTWDGQGVRSADDDRCAEHRLRLIEASPSLEDRIAALEAEVKALKGGPVIDAAALQKLLQTAPRWSQPEQPEQPAYAFGDPVEVYFDDKWLKGFVIGPHLDFSGEHKIAIIGCKRHGYDERGDWGYFKPKDIRPRVK